MSANAEVSVARCPILSRCFSIWTPGVSIGTMNAEMPLWPLAGSVFAKTTVQAAWPAFVMKVLEPLRTYSSPRRSAVVFSFATSEPASGSERPNEQRIGSSSSGGSHFACCSSLPAMITGPGAEAVGADRGADPGAAPVQLLADEDPLERRQSEPAEALRHVQVHQPERVRLHDQVGGMGLVLVVLGRLRPDLLVGELARELPQAALLLGEGERDARGDALLDDGHVLRSGSSID